ncbi:hypothetical protein WICPIJ_002414 [Wickerhamomyces pijperi]|uniref:Secreted protein n=1 Tax=Wickerhamomyces pijperi TaxID=599730 RepID=A0A9P8TPV1_WICPI|nr:hypothetical protein WICPIJ_002414 [Wickerhamomyces pijperi]
MRCFSDLADLSFIFSSLLALANADPETAALVSDPSTSFSGIELVLLPDASLISIFPKDSASIPIPVMKGGNSCLTSTLISSSISSSLSSLDLFLPDLFCSTSFNSGYAEAGMAPLAISWRISHLSGEVSLCLG